MELSSDYSCSCRPRHPRKQRVLMVDLELASIKENYGVGGLNLCVPSLTWSSFVRYTSSPKKTRCSESLTVPEVYAMVYIREETMLRTKSLRLDGSNNGSKVDRLVFSLGDDFCIEEPGLAVTIDVYRVVQDGDGEDVMVGRVRRALRRIVYRVGLSQEREKGLEDDDGGSKGEIVERGADVEWEGHASSRIGRQAEVKLKLQVWKEDFARARQSGGGNELLGLDGD